jgi:hypothetical protein
VSIENLIRAVPAPESPGDPFPGPWRDVEAKLGTALPADYKAFVQRYGLGFFMEYLWIWTPKAYDRHVRLEQEVPSVLKMFREDEYFSFKLWPEPGGLLPFGVTIDGDYLAWATEGPPESWRVRVLDRATGYEVAHAYDCDLTDFLAGVATDTISPPLFESVFFECEHPFIPDPRGPDPLVEVSWRLGPFGGAGRSVCRLGRR